MSIYDILGRFYPRDLRKGYVELLRYNKIEGSPITFIGFMLFFGFGLSLGLSFFLATWTQIPLWVYIISLFLGFQILIYLLLSIKADARGRFVEDILPDALQLMASNLRAGFTTDKALLLSARPEFGPLQEELNKVGRLVSTGKKLSTALLEMLKTIKSDKLEKTVLLINTGLESGGELAALLDQTSSNLLQTRFVEEKIKANVMMYVIFIFIAVAFGSPMLFALSTFLVEVLTKSIGSITLPDTATTSSLPISFTSVNISTDFIMTYALVMIISSAILGSMIIGLISKGKEREGLRYVLILVPGAIGVFFGIRFVVTNLLSGLFGF